MPSREVTNTFFSQLLLCIYILTVNLHYQGFTHSNQYIRLLDFCMHQYAYTTLLIQYTFHPALACPGTKKHYLLIFKPFNFPDMISYFNFGMFHLYSQDLLGSDGPSRFYLTNSSFLSSLSLLPIPKGMMSCISMLIYTYIIHMNMLPSDWSP